MPQNDASEETVPPPAMIGSLGCEAWILPSNFTASLTRKQVATQSEWKQRQHAITMLRNKRARILDVNVSPDLPQRLTIPMVSTPDLIGHFFVACFDISLHHPNFFVEISFFDSLERAKKRIHEASTAAAIMKKVNLLISTCILRKKKYQSLQQSANNLIRREQCKDSPSQNNGCDCGIFAVATTLHLAERIPSTSRSFSQSHITKARSELAKRLCFEPAEITTKNAVRRQIKMTQSTSR